LLIIAQIADAATTKTVRFIHRQHGGCSLVDSQDDHDCSVEPQQLVGHKEVGKLPWNIPHNKNNPSNW
jgi:hypothetical protein